MNRLLERRLNRLEQRARARIDRHIRDVRAMSQENGLTLLVNVYAVEEALHDSRLGDGAAEFLAMCFLSARDGGERECFGCLEPWQINPPRAPVSLAIVEVIDRSGKQAEGAMFSGLCEQCSGRYSVIMAACKRDFGVDAKPIMHEGGTA